MKGWIKSAEERLPELLYYRLEEVEPLDVLFNPFSQVTGTIAATQSCSSLEFLDECLRSEMLQKRKMALLSLRKVARVYPNEGKATLKFAWERRFDSTSDDQYRSWLDVTIRELQLLHPKMAYSFSNSVKMTQAERLRIKRVEASVKSNEYKVDAFWRWLAENDLSRSQAMSWYNRMLTSESREEFCAEVAQALLR